MSNPTTAHPFSDQQIAALTKRAIDPQQAHEHGVLAIAGPDDFPEGCDAWWSKHTPGLLFPWTSPDGETTWQYRPDTPVDIDGAELKYLYPKGSGSVLNVLKTVDTDLALIQEGTCQSLAAKLYTNGVSVYGIGGCWSWRRGKVSLPELEVVEGKNVVLSFDADIATNPNVHSAAKALMKACLDEGALSVKFLIASSSGNTGLDDVLATRKPERRAKYLANLIEHAEKLPAAPKAAAVKKAAADDAKARLEADHDRPMIVVNDDRWKVINDLSTLLTTRWSGTRCFNHGGIISEFTGTSMRPLDKGIFLNLIQETSTPVQRVPKGDAEFFLPAWPDSQTIMAVTSRAGEYAPLDQIAHAPFVRPDGTICIEAGYDEATRTMLILTQALAGLDVPEHPTSFQVKQAVEFLQWWLTDILNKMPDAGSRANTLGLLLTPFTRGMYPTAPLAVIDGVDAGVGKGILMDLFSQVWKGTASTPQSYNDSDDENRKMIFSAVRSGADLIWLDEAHFLQGGSLSKNLTAPVIEERILGVSQIAAFPNRITWVSSGNQVQMKGDIFRRVYRIRIEPNGPWLDREQTTFTIPDIQNWTSKNRGKLLSAVLTIIRSWHLAGRPEVTKDFASFNEWQGIVGGILAHAGIEGFLEGRKVWREQADFGKQYWQEFLEWSLHQMGSGPFVLSDLVEAMKKSRFDVPTPPDMDDYTADGYARRLGQAFAKQAGRHGALRLIRGDTQLHGGKVQWRIEVVAEDADKTVSAPAEGTGDNGGNAYPTHEEKTSSKDDHEDAYTSYVNRGRAVTSVVSVPSTVADAHKSDNDILSQMFDSLGVPMSPCAKCGGEQTLLFGQWYACPVCDAETVASAQLRRTL